jgi:hypothetical protein
MRGYLVPFFIIVFWVVMTILFIRKEVIPSLPSLVQPSYEAYLKTSDYDKDIKMNIFFRGQSIGFSHTIINPLKDNYTSIDNTTKISLPVFLGNLFDSNFTADNTKDKKEATGITMELIGKSIIDSDYNLKSFDFSAKSPFLNYTISGEVKNGILDFTTYDGVRHLNNRLPYKSASTVSDGLSPFISMPHLSVGKEWVINFVNPFTASMQTLQARVENLTKIDWKDKMHDVYEVKLSNPKMHKQINYTAYITPDGKILKQEILFPGLYLIRE